MGKLIYNSSNREIEIEDRTLAHLQIVIAAKLRRGESFPLSWKDDTSTGSGRTTVWLHPRCALVYKFHGSRLVRLNHAWMDALTHSANSPAGLQVVPEPPQPSADGPYEEGMVAR